MEIDSTKIISKLVHIVYELKIELKDLKSENDFLRKQITEQNIVKSDYRVNPETK